MTEAVNRLARRSVVVSALVALPVLGCGAPEPAPAQGTATSAPRETPELGWPRPKLLPPEAVAATARTDRE